MPVYAKMAKKKIITHYNHPNQDIGNIIIPIDYCKLLRVKEIFPLDKDDKRLDKEHKKLDDLTEAAFMAVHYNHIPVNGEISKNKLKKYTIDYYNTMSKKFEIKNYWDLERKVVSVNLKRPNDEITGIDITGSF